MMRRTWFQGKAFAVALVLLVGGMAATTAYTLWRQRADAIDSGLRISSMYTRSFEDFLTQSLYLTEVVAANTVPMYNWTRNLRSVEHAFVATIRQAPFVLSLIHI